MDRCDCPPYDCAGRVARYLGGDRAAGDDLAQRFTPLVRAVVQRVLGPGRRGEWDDACQAVFARVFAHLATWQRRCPFCKWLAVVAARQALDCRTPPSVPLPTAEPAARAPAERLPLERIDGLVASWPAERQQVFTWLLEGVPHADMAQKLGKSLRTLQYWLSDMRAEIRKCLEGD